MDKSLYVLGGSAWINLVNTTYIHNKQLVDTLHDHGSTLQWLKENNLMRVSDALALENEELLHQLIDDLYSLRHLCKVILSDIEQHGKLSVEAAKQLKRLVEQLKVGLTLVPTEEKQTLVCQGMTPKDHVLYEIAHSIIHTLESISPDRIRRCEHEECILYFVDTSKSGKRRWCSMELCGNRQKAAEFYARKKKKME
jgi:predicted RNA-binding Zn ribbon-like protein